jgi:hypothetical protein
LAKVPSDCYRNSTYFIVFEFTYACSLYCPSSGWMSMSVVVSYGKGKAVDTLWKYVGYFRHMLHSFVTVPDLCQGKEPLVLLNRWLNVPQSQSGCFGKEINLLLLLTIEHLLGVQPVAWSQYWLCYPSVHWYHMTQ